MGLNGRLLIGTGILINPVYLPEEWVQFCQSLSDKYADLFEFNRMDGISKNDAFLIWKDKPEVIFPSNILSPRRPLIINSTDQLKLMKPSGESMCLDNEQLWNPSYENFIIQLDELEDQEKTYRLDFSNDLKNKLFELEHLYVHQEEYEANKSFSIEKSPIKQPLTETEWQHLSILINNPNYTLIGKFLVYLVD